MCGRFTQAYTWAEVHAYLSLLGTTPKNLQAHYNLAPTDTVEVVRLQAGRRDLVSMRWGLIPYWWKKSLKELPATFNARVETVAEKPMFRDAFQRKRCLIPASGFFEWTGDKKARQPHYFTAADGSLLAIAGLWDRWRDPSGEEVLSCTMIVSDANSWMAPFHDRMPVMLEEKDFDAWLSGEAGLEVLKPAPREMLREWLVSTRMNKTGVGDDDPSIVTPIDEPDN